MDRIDLYCYVGAVRHDNLLDLDNDSSISADQQVRDLVLAARKLQLERFSYGTSQAGQLNTHMDNNAVRQHARLTFDARQSLDSSAGKYQLSARSYFRSLKVARTIADLAGSYEITKLHVDEAVQLNPALLISERPTQTLANNGARRVEGHL